MPPADRPSLPPWPAGYALRLRGRFPTLERDLGDPPVVYEANQEWSFTYPLPIRIPSQFAIHVARHAADPAPLVGLDEEGLYVIPNPDGLQRDLMFSTYLDDRGQVTAFLPKPGMVYDFGEHCTLMFPNSPKGIRVIAERVRATANASPEAPFFIPNVDWRSIKPGDNLAKFLAETDVPRGLASCIDLPPSLFRALIPCPDPVTRALLVKNPNLPTEFLGWAAGYPSALSENVSAGVLLSSLGLSYGNPIASASPGLQDSIIDNLV